MCKETPTDILSDTFMNKYRYALKEMYTNTKKKTLQDKSADIFIDTLDIFSSYFENRILRQYK